MDDDPDLALLRTLCRLVERTPGATVEWLVAQARRERRDARITEETVQEQIFSSPLLVGRPDGSVIGLADLLDGCIFTQRVRADTAGRNDLWANVSLQPILSLLWDHPLPYKDGGEVALSPFGDDALCGPDGWLPDVPAYKLVGIRWQDGCLSAERVTRPRCGPRQRQEVAALIAHHYAQERWWAGNESLETRPAELLKAIVRSKLEEPTLFAQPLPPLSELLYDPLEQEQHQTYWRELSASRMDSVGFYVSGMPEYLHIELGKRAQEYGMSFDQYVIAVLGHLAWRTPFAEDLQPWESWWPSEIDKPVHDASVLPIAPTDVADSGSDGGWPV